VGGDGSRLAAEELQEYLHNNELASVVFLFALNGECCCILCVSPVPSAAVVSLLCISGQAEKGPGKTQIMVVSVQQCLL
jgi:hypothetical protein